MAGRKGAIEGDPRAADRQSLRLDNPLVVQWEYASEERLAQRNLAYRNLVEGASPEEVAFEAVAEVRPERVLEVGCGTGEFAERVRDELGSAVCAVDLSPRMVELTAARGLDAQVADVQSLPFEDGRFDCVIANWVLYHLADVDRGVAEIARVLRPGGRLVAATLGEGNMQELWDLLGGTPTRDLNFQSGNGERVLRRHFPRVEMRDASGIAVFPSPKAMRDFVAATVTRAHLSSRVPEFDGEFRTRTSHVVFVADKPA